MYKGKIGKVATQIAIFETEKTFKKHLSKELSLMQIKGPLFVDPKTGVNDNLSGIETAVSFKHKEKTLEIVQSLAKWKRTALGKLEMPVGKGVFVEMHAIRKDESELSPYHSLHVDQYDWEKVIAKTDRKLETLFSHVKRIYKALYETKQEMKSKYSALTFDMAKDITFISSEELLKKFPHLTPEEREQEIVKQHKAVFIYGIGHKLSDGVYHGARAFDYDDWTLNGDIIVWDYQRQSALEISSMGIRVDEKAILSQAEIVEVSEEKFLQFHKDVVEMKLPYTIGGGIGRSRINLFILEKAHIGEVNSVYWPESYKEEWKEKGVELI